MLNETTEDDVQELTWRLFDDEIERDQFDRLELYLREEEQARALYVRCAWLHAELTWYFRNERQQKEGGVQVAEDRFLTELLSGEGKQEAKDIRDVAKRLGEPHEPHQN